MICWFCKKEGHFRRNCPSRKKNQENDFEQSSAANLTDGYNTGYDSSEGLTISELSPGDEWILDSGCTFHMTPRKDWLINFKQIEGGKVLMGNDHSCNVTGSGSVRFKLWDGSHRILDNVRWVPKLRRNLISLGMLDVNGSTYKSENGVLRVMKGSMVMLKGVLKQGLYVLQGEAITGDAAATSVSQDQTLLWHKRLGHISMGGLQQLCKQGILDSIKITEMDLCEVCILGKNHRLKFTTSTYRSNAILEYVHSNLWGSPKVPVSLSGAHYFISFVDDFSRKVWIYFLKQKSEAFDKFREWKLLVENQTGKRIKHLRTDNGLEYCNSVFSQCCIKFGIERHLTCRETP